MDTLTFLFFSKLFILDKGQGGASSKRIGESLRLLALIPYTQTVYAVDHF